MKIKWLKAKFNHFDMNDRWTVKNCLKKKKHTTSVSFQGERESESVLIYLSRRDPGILPHKRSSSNHAMSLNNNTIK